MGKLTPIVKYIIIVNVVLWLATILFFNANILDLNDILAFHYPGSPLYQPWQFLTHMFMHASIGGGGIVIYHILFNMLGVWMFGSPLETLWGRNKFIFFYISSGLGAVLVQLAFYYFEFQSGMEIMLGSGFSSSDVYEIMVRNIDQINGLSPELIANAKNMQSIYLGSMLGASGALYGILVAFAFTYPNAELMMIFLPIPIKAKYFVPLLFLGDLFFGFSNSSSGVAHFAHVGGAITGFIMMWYWKKNQFNNNRWN